MLRTATLFKSVPFLRRHMSPFFDMFVFTQEKCAFRVFRKKPDGGVESRLFFFTAVGAQSVQWECRYAFRGWTDDAGNAAWPQPKQRAKEIPITGGFESRRNSEHAVNARQYGTYSVHMVVYRVGCRNID